MKKLFFISCLILSSIYNFAANQISIKDNQINIERAEIQLSGGQFSVVIVENEKLKEIKPKGDPVVHVESCSTPIGDGTQKIFSWITHEGYKIKFILTTINDDVFSIKGEFVNGSLQPVYLKTFNFLKTPEDSFQVKGLPADWVLASTDVESRRWGTLDLDIPTERELQEIGAYSRKYLIAGGNEEKINDRKWRGFYDDMILYSKKGTGLSVSAVDIISDVYFDVKVMGTRMKLEIWGQMSEVLVESGQSRTSDEVLFMFTSWNKAQKNRNKWVAHTTKANLKKKPVYGWCSWYRTGTRVTQEEIEDITSYVRKKENQIPFEVIQIDDGWQIGKFNWVENEKFSKGLEALADSITAAGMTPGIWLSPVRVDQITAETGKSRRPLPEEWYVNYKSGNTDNGKLDPSHPEAAAFMTKHLRYCYNKGYRYFKLDFAKIPLEATRFYDPNLTRFQAQRELFRLYREAIGDESYLLACGICDQRTLAPFVDADRIGTDCGPLWGFARKLAPDNMPAQIHGLWFPIVSMANKCYENGVLSHGDPDVTYLAHTKQTRPKQLLTFNSYIGIYGGLALTSDKLYLPEFDRDENLRIMEVMYPISEEKGHSFSGGYDMYGKEFGYEVKRSYGNSVNVILWNPEHDGEADLTMKNVPTKNIGSKFHAWSFWDEIYKGVVENNYVAHDVPKYEHELLKFTALSEKPTIVGSNLHISMGATEVLSVDSSEKQMQITLDPNAGARNGKLFIYSEKPLSNAKSSNSEAFISKKADELYVLTLNGRSRDKEELITIEIGGEDARTENQILNKRDLRTKYEKASFSKSWLKSW